LSDFDPRASDEHAHSGDALFVTAASCLESR
jgi:hypothetical protein